MSTRKLEIVDAMAPLSGSSSQRATLDASQLMTQDVRTWLRGQGIHATVSLTAIDGSPLSETQERQVQDCIASWNARARQLEHYGILGETSSSIAHETRNVLSGIIGLCQLSQDGATSDRVDLIVSEAQRGAGLLSQFLSVASSRVTQAAELTASSVLEPVELLLRTEAKSRQCRLSVHIDANVPTFFGHAITLRQALMNLTLNAIDACAAGSHIELSCKLVTGGIALRVLDNGPGIAPEHLAHIFEPQFSASTGNHGGSGLGLPISRKLVEEMGGTLSGSNRPEGGACFEIFLPVSAAPRVTLPVMSDSESPPASVLQRGDHD